MKDFKRNKQRFGGPGRFGGSRDRPEREFTRDRPRRDFNEPRREFSRDRPQLEMHEVTCDKCGKKCEVPFKPSSNKPVYCSDCFRKESPSRDSSGELEQINKKLDKILRALKIE